ncbi:hypothetical protein AVEN_183692-1 [Araneus ventricosus]|uniref:Uncharacterized protein n=1 Tax=Araneus ventricosus TaxID=182803 RepID=A0A4Y2TRE1_ARAVE|nr:hypothetical protein AVEN_183692-1 [Araneus ventricosus]
MPTEFRILCTHEGAEVWNSREIGFSEKAGLRSVIQSEVIPCRHSGCGFSQTTNSFSTDDLSRSARVCWRRKCFEQSLRRFRKTASFARPPTNFRTVWWLKI